MTSTLQHRLPRALTALTLALVAACSQAADFNFSGQMAFHNDLVQIDFTVGAPCIVRLWTDSWQGGLNVDPLLSLFNSGFSLVASNDDDTVAAGQGFYDAGLSLPLAGSYRLVLSASSNDALSPTLADGFTHSADTPIRLADWVQPSSDINLGDQKGGAWQVHLSGVTLAAAVPEPQSFALMLAGLLGVGLVARRRRPR